MTKAIEDVLAAVKTRQGLGSFGWSTFFWTLVFAGVYLAAFLGARLLALWPDVFAGFSIALVPALGLAMGFLSHRRANLAGAARATDGHLGTEDLFLTSLETDRAAGEYQDLVRYHATTHASKVRPAEIAPLPFAPNLARVAVALGLLWLAVTYVPQLDPFGGAEERILLANQSKQLVAERKAIEQRLKALKDKPLDDKNSEEVAKALLDAMRTFKQMRKKTPQKNSELLKDKQRAIGKRWREARARQKDQGSPSPRLQSIGRMRSPREDEWSKDLAQGSSKSLRRELKELRDLLDKIAGAKTAAEREKLRKKLQERTKDLADFLRNNASSRQLNQTLSKALNQLQALGNKKLAKDAENALRQTLELSEKELKNLAQSLRDMKELEKAMKALQKARQANEKSAEGKGDKKKAGENGEGLDGDMTPDLKSLEEYERYYEELLAKLGAGGNGKGMGGEGQGEGGVAPENNDQKNAFKTEKSKSALLAGKILMSLKTKEVGDRGKVERTYTENLNQVKQGVGEAILQERVPPGYHEGIKKYFDTLDPSREARADSGGKRKSAGKARKK